MVLLLLEMTVTAKGPHDIVKGVKALGRYIQTHRRRFAASPILLIEADTSSPLQDSNNISNSSSGMVETLAGRHVHLILAQQMGLRTLVSKGGHGGDAKTHPGASSFVAPTADSVHEQVDLYTRMGAGTVCGVGSRASLDLAKAVAAQVASSNTIDNDNNTDPPELILVPDTLDAILTCVHPHALLLHDQEDVLLPHPSTTTPTNTTVALLEPDKFQHHPKETRQSMATALYACMTLLSHAVSTQTETSVQEDANQVLERCKQLLVTSTCTDSQAGEETHNAVADKLLQVGTSCLEFGLIGSQLPRSIPLAVTVSLLPTVFPDKDLLTILASMTVQPSDEKDILPPPLLATNQSVEQLLDLIQTNQTHWNCLDASRKELRAALEPFSLVPSS